MNTRYQYKIQVFDRYSGKANHRFHHLRRLATNYFIFDIFSIFFPGYCGILWGPTQGLTTDTFEVSSTATAQTVN